MNKKLKKLDKALDKLIVKTFPKRSRPESYTWWWNANDIIALTIISAARHVRDDGCHLLTQQDAEDLTDLEQLFSAFYETQDFGPPGERDRAMQLFALWFERLWD